MLEICLTTPQPSIVVVFVEVHWDDIHRLAIGRLRYDVWEAEGSIDKDIFPDRLFVDELDKSARHFTIHAPDGTIVAAARLTWHESLDDSYRDMQLWVLPCLAR